MEAGNHTENGTLVCEVVNENTVSCDGEEYHNELLFQPTNALFWIYLGLYLVLVLFAGRCSRVGSDKLFELKASLCRPLCPVASSSMAT